MHRQRIVDENDCAIINPIIKISLPACSRLEVVAPVDDKKLVSYPGARHILHMESEDCRIEFVGGTSLKSNFFLNTLSANCLDESEINLPSTRWLWENQTTFKEINQVKF